MQIVSRPVSKIQGTHQDLDNVVPEREGVAPPAGAGDIAPLPPVVLGEVHTRDALVDAGIVLHGSVPV